VTGAEALANFRRADQLVQDGKLDEARAMKDQLLSTDWSIRLIASSNSRSDDEENTYNQRPRSSRLE